MLKMHLEQEEMLSHLMADNTGWTGTNPMLFTAAYFCAQEYFGNPDLYNLFGAAFEIAYMGVLKIYRISLLLIK